MKYIYQPIKGRFTPGYKVGKEYEGDFKDNPNFQPVKEPPKTKDKEAK